VLDVKNATGEGVLERGNKIEAEAGVVGSNCEFD